MTQISVISIVALLGWLFLAGSALTSYKLGWNKMVQMALIWAAIFAGGFVIVRLFM